MHTWILILFFHVGPFGEGNSNATTNITGFISQEECTEAGKEAKKLASGSVKTMDFVCVKQTLRVGSY
jgi:hypothetical protein